MPESFFERLPLARSEVDRDYLARENADLIDELRADPATRVLPILEGTALLSTPTSLALLPFEAIPPAELLVYLGRTTTSTPTEPAGTAVLAAQLLDAGDLAEWEWGNLRSLATRLSHRDAGLLTEALAIINWHDSHQFSPRTGERTMPGKGGWVRREPDTDREVFPRTDAAIIVGVIDENDRILLGSNALWESNRYSLLAGFVEPGESLEAAVIREVFEESGIRVIDPVYLGSQPWPFPASLMLGFMARVDPTFPAVLTPDGAEILDLRWFTRDELRDSVGEVILPGASSIARAIVEEWYGGRIDERPR